MPRPSLFPACASAAVAGVLLSLATGCQSPSGLGSYREHPGTSGNGNFVIGPTYAPAPERKKVDGVPEGKVQQFEIDSKDTKLFNPGIKRDKFGTVDPNNPKTLIVETHEIDYKRAVTVYVPVERMLSTDSFLRSMS